MSSGRANIHVTASVSAARAPLTPAAPVLVRAIAVPSVAAAVPVSAASLPTASASPTAAVARNTRITAPELGLAYVTHPVMPLNPRNYGPLLGALVGLVREIQYVTADQKPSLNPVQLPSSPSQKLVAGTLNAYTLSGDPFTVTVTGQPTRGTVTIDPTSGSYTYTPNAALAATGGTDTFTITATDTGFHLIATLLGLPTRATTITVPVTVAAAQSTGANGETDYYVTNTSYQPMKVGYTTNQASQSPASGTVLSTGETALFRVQDGSTVSAYFNPLDTIHEVAAHLNVGFGPSDVALSPDGSTIYVACEGHEPGDGTVAVVNAATKAVTATIAVGGQAFDVAVSPDGATAYVTNFPNNSVSVINTATNTVTGNIDVSNGPFGVAFSHDGTTAYVTTPGQAGHTVAVIDTATRTVIKTIDVGLYPFKVAISPDGATAYVANFGSNSVSVIDTATNAVTDTIGVGTSPVGVAFSTDGEYAYVTNGGENSVSVITRDPATGSGFVSSVITVGTSSANPYGVAVNPTLDYAYVGDFGGNTVSVISTDKTSLTFNAVIDSLPVGSGPTGIAVSPDGTTIYTAAIGSNWLSVISTVPSGYIGDGGVAQYTLTLSGGTPASCSAKGSNQCASDGTTAYLEDPPGTKYTVPSDQAQQQTNVLQDLVYDDLSNATYYTKSQAAIGYTNPMKVDGFKPYTNNTTSPSTDTYVVSSSTSTASNVTWNVSVKVTEEGKLFGIGLKAEEGAQRTWGTTTTDTQTYSQSTTQTVQVGETLYIYSESPIYRFFGDWSVLYGNTTYYLSDVWYDTPYAANSLYPAYLGAYTCEAGSEQCAQVAAGDLSSYKPAFPLDVPTYEVCESADPSNCVNYVAPPASSTYATAIPAPSIPPRWWGRKT
jgi:YVTN family beta-propeller protein